MQDECNILIMIMTLLHVLSKEKKMYIVYKAPLTPRDENIYFEPFSIQLHETGRKHILKIYQHG